ncbi:MAG: sulfur oxidation c-type cytochrome SoxA [Pseudomonadota bacterium]|nr:sulfur oxidation c-type cytochrome SoxA [Pseudomonadota bacterium]
MPSTMRRTLATGLAASALVAVVGGALAQSTTDEIARYREALQDGNPAELWEARGEEMWTRPRGPKQVSFASCDLGLGPGVVKGAYARLPRYFPDAGRVMDLETRLVWCMVNQQGYAEADALKNKFGNGSAHRSDLETLAAYVTSQSRGVTMNVALDEPHVHDMYRLGEKMFYYRGGTHDFSCATCHGDDGKRIRLQDLPNLTTVEGAQKAYTTWPAYRVSQGEVRTFQWRLNDCFRQQRFPELEFGSDASIALTAYLAGRANGAEYNGPAIKR